MCDIVLISYCLKMRATTLEREHLPPYQLATKKSINLILNGYCRLLNVRVLYCPIFLVKIDF